MKMRKNKVFLLIICILIILAILISVFSSVKETKTEITGISTTFGSDTEVNLSKDKTSEIAEPKPPIIL